MRITAHSPVIAAARGVPRTSVLAAASHDQLGRWVVDRLEAVRSVGDRGIVWLITDFGASRRSTIGSQPPASEVYMTGDHYIVIRVEYDGHPSYGRSL